MGPDKFNAVDTTLRLTIKHPNQCEKKSFKLVYCYGDLDKLWPDLLQAWNSLVPRHPQVSFDVTSPIKLVGKTRLGNLPLNGKSKTDEQGQVPNFSRKNPPPNLFLPFTMLLKCSEGMYLTYM